MGKANDRKSLLAALVVSEKDLESLKEWIEKSKEFFKIEKDTGRIILAAKSKKLSISDQIILVLIGKYFAKELDFIGSLSISLNTLKNEVMTSGRSLSRPLGILMNGDIIKKDKAGYQIRYYRIETCLDTLSQGKSLVEPKRKKSKKVRSKKAPILAVIPLDKDGIKKLASDVGIGENELKNIFDFTEQDIDIISDIRGVTEKERQVTATLLYMTAHKYCFGKREVYSGTLREKLKNLGIGGLVNLSTTLKPHRRLIIHEPGQKGKTDRKYRITIPGEREGLRRIRYMANSLRECEEDQEETVNRDRRRI